MNRISAETIFVTARDALPRAQIMGDASTIQCALRDRHNMRVDLNGGSWSIGLRFDFVPYEVPEQVKNVEMVRQLLRRLVYSRNNKNRRNKYNNGKARRQVDKRSGTSRGQNSRRRAVRR